MNFQELVRAEMSATLTDIGRHHFAYPGAYYDLAEYVSHLATVRKHPDYEMAMIVEISRDLIGEGT